MPLLNILMVDTREADRRLMREAFSSVTDCLVWGFPNGRQAADYLRTGGQADLILVALDSEKAGEFLRTLRAKQEWKDIPVATLGCSPQLCATPNEQTSAAYRSKPFDFDSHVRLAAELVHLAAPHACCTPTR
jgi:CheY-like chemotaxis protein